MGRTSQAFALDRLYSLVEFENLNLPSDGSKYELIEGALHVSPPAGDEHGRIGSRITKRINLFDPEDKLGMVWQTTRFQVAPGFGPAPDVAFIMAAHLPPTTKGAVTIRPDLAVEVWSPGDLDTKAHREEARSKVRRYQVAGVSVVWAINPLNRTVEVFHPGQINAVQVLGVADELNGEDVIPGFKLAVRLLFE